MNVWNILTLGLAAVASVDARKRSDRPTKNPTIHPTVKPSQTQSLNPTRRGPQTKNPTLDPTTWPTFGPTVLPSSQPSSSPTEQTCFDANEMFQTVIDNTLSDSAAKGVTVSIGNAEQSQCIPGDNRDEQKVTNFLTDTVRSGILNFESNVTLNTGNSTVIADSVVHQIRDRLEIENIEVSRRRLGTENEAGNTNPLEQQVQAEVTRRLEAIKFKGADVKISIDPSKFSGTPDVGAIADSIMQDMVKNSAQNRKAGKKARTEGNSLEFSGSVEVPKGEWEQKINLQKDNLRVRGV